MVNKIKIAWTCWEIQEYTSTTLLGHEEATLGNNFNFYPTKK